MRGIDDHPRQPRGVEHALLLVEIPAARLLRQQPPLEPVGEPGDDIGKPAHLLVEIGAEPPELLLVAQLVGLDDLVEAGGEGLVVGLRRQIPVAPAGRGESAFADARRRRAPRSSPTSISVGASLVGRAVLGLLAAHLDVAAAGRAFVALLGACPRRRLSSPSSSSPPSSGSSSDGSSAAARSRSSSSRRESLANAAWSSSVSASASSSAAAFSSIHGATSLSPASAALGGASPVSRSRAMQADRGRQRHLLGGARADDRVAAHARFGQVGEVVA